MSSFRVINLFREFLQELPKNDDAGIIAAQLVAAHIAAESAVSYEEMSKAMTFLATEMQDTKTQHVGS